MFCNIGFIGCGNMGSAVSRAVAKSACGLSLSFANRGAEKALSLAGELGGCLSDNRRIARECELIFLGVKPQIMPQLLDEIAPVLRERRDRFVLVSMAAGLGTQAIREMAGGDYPIIRIMPNTPAAVGEGTVLVCQLGATEVELDEFCRLLEPSGLVDIIPEGLIDAASAVSGCGVAFVCLFIEALADGGVACGLPRDRALKYAEQTVLGMGKLALDSGEHPGALKDKICSPGGTTIQGVRALERGGLRSAIMEAVSAAYDKTLEIGKGTGK